MKDISFLFVFDLLIEWIGIITVFTVSTETSIKLGEDATVTVARFDEINSKIDKIWELIEWI